jgi:hypothetical protein
MQEATQEPTIDQLLCALAQIVEEERTALIQLDVAGIEHAAANKLTLNEQLLGRRTDFSDVHRQRLRQIQTDLRHNLILLVHARDYIQNTLGVLTKRVPGTSERHPTAADGVRLDLRG